MARRAKSDPAAKASFLPQELYLEHLIDNIERYMLDALNDVVGDVEQTAVSTTAYEDDTSATRNSTIAYVSTPGTLPQEVEIAQAVANGYRPGSATDEPPPPAAPGTLDLVAYSATDYSLFLNVRGAGETMYLAEAIELNTPRITDACDDALIQLMGVG
jgi:hypothetical protein